MTDEAQKAQQTPEALMKDILERAGLEDFNDIPIGIAYAWGKAGLWKPEQPVPIAGYEFLRVFALFQGHRDVHTVTVYAVPVASPHKDSGHEALAHRFTLSKDSATYFIEIVRNIEVFKDELAADMARIAQSTSDALYGDDNAAAAALVEEARALITAGKHREALDLLAEDAEEEEDEDEDEPAPSPV